MNTAQQEITLNQDIINTIIKIFLRYEGSQDLNSLKAIVNRIAYECETEIEIVKCVESGGDIKRFIISDAETAFEENIDIYLCFGDQDKKPTSFRSEINKTLKTANQAYFDMTVVGISDRNLEAWLIADHNLVKEYFSLDHTKPLRDIADPKHLLNSYWSEWSVKPKPMLSDSMLHLANNLDMQEVANSKKCFNTFRQDFKKKLKKCS